MIRDKFLTSLKGKRKFLAPMDFINTNFQLNSVSQIDWIERWNIYNRLQELAIPCTCSIGQPLQVQVETAGVAVQVWSVVQQFIAPRLTKVDYLERCWQQQH